MMSSKSSSLWGPPFLPYMHLISSLFFFTTSFCLSLHPLVSLYIVLSFASFVSFSSSLCPSLVPNNFWSLFTFFYFPPSLLFISYILLPSPSYIISFFPPLHFLYPPSSHPPSLPSGLFCLVKLRAFLSDWRKRFSSHPFRKHKSNQTGSVSASRTIRTLTSNRTPHPQRNIKGNAVAL